MLLFGDSQVVLVVKNLPANAEDIRDVGLIPELGRSPQVGHGNPLQHPCLEGPMDRGARHATVYRVQRLGHNGSIMAHPYIAVQWLSHV